MSHFAEQVINVILSLQIFEGLFKAQCQIFNWKDDQKRPQNFANIPKVQEKVVQILIFAMSSCKKIR